jgi:hypothetical protein
MALEIINIGIEGNDGTGDSIREAFKKVNRNFDTLFAVFGQGGELSFLVLDDVADTPVDNGILIWNDQLDKQIVYKTLEGQGGIQIDATTNPDKIVIENTSNTIRNDLVPELSNDVKVNGVMAYVDNVNEALKNGFFRKGEDVANPDDDGLIEQWRNTHGQDTTITEENLIISKGYGDTAYIAKDGDITSGPILVPDTTSFEPFDTTESDGVTGKVYDRGDVVTYQGDFYKASRRLELEAGDTFSLADWAPIGSIGSQVIPSNEAVKKAGDEMDGGAILKLGEHPGVFAGLGTTFAADDLQAVSKLYVDRTSFNSANNIYVSKAGDDAQRTSPPGLEGRSYSNAFSSVNAACRAAEEEIRIAEVQPGPYMQTITTDNGENFATVVGANWTTEANPITKTIIESNVKFLTEEAIYWARAQIENSTSNSGLSSTDPKWFLFSFDEFQWRADLTKLVNAMLFDVISSNTGNANDQTILNSLILRRNHRREINEWRAVVEQVEVLMTLCLDAIQVSAENLYQVPEVEGDPTSVPYQQYISPDQAEPAMRDHILGADGSAENYLFDIHYNAYVDGLEYTDTLTVVEGTPYIITMDDGTSLAVDQGREQTDPNSLVTTTDLLPGKVVRGKSTGAIGKIISYERNNATDNDELTVQLLEPIEFTPGEELEYGNFIKDKQITIFIESGEYFEELPIRIPANVSIKGDEFRRSIISPKPGVSTSKWANLYFYRDAVFDNLKTINYYGPNIATHIGRTIQPTITPTEVATSFEKTSIINLSEGDAPKSWIGGFIVAADGGEAWVQSVNGTELVVKITVPFANTNTIAWGDWSVYRADPYGFHYLQDPSRPLDNGGRVDIDFEYEIASRFLQTNRSFIIAEVQAYMNTYYPDYTTPGALRGRIGALVDAIVHDLLEGQNHQTLKAQAGFYNSQVVNSQATDSYNVLQYVKLIITAIINKDPSYVVLNQLNAVRVIEPVDAESGVLDIILDLVDLSTYWYDTTANRVRTTYNPAKRNEDMDMFFVNDGVIIRNITGSRHGGFMQVQDPGGQILTRSPYTQTCSSFTKGFTPFRGVAKKFRGGMFNDGYVGNMKANILAVSNGGLTLDVETPVLEGGLRYRKPLTPAPFYYDGERYTINAVTDYNAVTGTAKLQLDETTPYSGTVTAFTNFAYDKYKCERDVKYFIDAIKFDAAFNNNYRTIASAIRYYSGAAAEVINSQKDATAAAFAQAKTYTSTELSDPGYTLRVEALWDEVIDIVQNGTANADPYVYPDPTGGTGNGNDVFYRNAREQIIINKDFIIQELITWIDFQVTNSLDPYETTFNYDSSKCARDAGYILDALIYDLTYGGNLQTFDAAMAYFVDGVAQYGDGQKEETIAAYERLKNLVYQVIREEIVTVTPGTILTQNTTLDPGNIDAADFAAARVQEIIDYINSEGITPPTRVEPDITWTSGTEQAQFALLDSTAAKSIAEQTTDWLATQVTQVVLQTAGNRSLLGNDYTQVNDNGYGLVVTNNALSEMVSVFTYYCHISYYANNGGQIRSLNGSNANGKFGLVAAGRDPDEIPTPVQLRDNTAQACKIYNVDTEIQLDGITVNLTKGMTVTQASTGATGTVSFDLANSDTIYLENVTGGSFEDADIQFDTTGANTTITAAQILGVAQVSYTSNSGQNYVYAYDFTTRPQSGSEVYIYFPGLNEYKVFPIVNASDEDPIFGPFGVIAGSAGSTYDIDNTIYRLNFTSGIGGDDDNRLPENVSHSTLAEFHNRTTHVLEESTQTIPVGKLVIRPSTAIQFDITPDSTARTINFQQVEDPVTGIPVTPTQITTRFDTGIDVFPLQVILAETTNVDPDDAGKTLGANAGDTKIAVVKINELDKTAVDNAALLGDAEKFIFVWKGRTHFIDSIDDSNTDYDIVSFSDSTDNDLSYDDGSETWSATGLAINVNKGNLNGPSILAGLQDGADATISIRISTNRATSHDFLDIGTGGYNDTNYPEQIYGIPSDENSPVTAEGAVDDAGTNTKAQVQERTTGRVFFTSSDQDGFFRVGKFFSVDQGTGELDFGGRIRLTQVTGLGFEQGVTITEFSNDASFNSPNDETVPTEKAVNTYINRRLGMDRDGNSVGATKIGPGVLPLDGGDDFQMTGLINMGGNTITNIPTPDDNLDPDDVVVNKGYVLGKLTGSNTFDGLYQVETDVANPPEATDIFMASGKKRLFLLSMSSPGFNVGDVFRGGGIPQDTDGDPGTPPEPVSGNTTSKGRVVDVQQGFTAPNGVTYIILTYEAVEDIANPGVFYSDVFDNTDAQLTEQTLNGVVYEDAVNPATGRVSGVNNDGALNEYIFAKQEIDLPGLRDIQFESNRDEDGSEYYATIRNNRITNAMVNSTAGIIQSKLNLDRAPLLDNSTGLEGEELNPNGQDSRGLAAFDNSTFAEEVVLTLSSQQTFAEGDKISISGDSKVGYVVEATSSSTQVRIRTASNFVSGDAILQNDETPSLATIVNDNSSLDLYGVQHTGFIDLIDYNLSYDKMQPLAASSLIGNDTSAVGQPRNITIESVIETGLIEKAITINTGILPSAIDPIQVLTYNYDIDDGYSLDLTGASTSNLPNGLVIRDVNNYINTAGIRMTNDSAVNIFLSGDELVLNNKLATGGEVLRSASGQIVDEGGANEEVFPLKILTKGNIVVGEIATSTDEESVLHANSLWGTTGGAADPNRVDGNGDPDPKPRTIEKSALATRWLYTNFIEAANEKTETSTGIALGAGTGFDSAGDSDVGAQKITLVTGGTERLVVREDNVEVLSPLLTTQQETVYRYRSANDEPVHHTFYKDKSTNEDTASDGDVIGYINFQQEDEFNIKRRFAAIEVSAKEVTGAVTPVTGIQRSAGKGKISFQILEPTQNNSDETPLSEVLSEQMYIDDVDTKINTNVVLGSGNSQSLEIKSRLSSSIVPATKEIYDLGAATLRWNNIYAHGDISTDAGSISVAGTITAAKFATDTDGKLTLEGGIEFGGTVAADILPLGNDVDDQTAHSGCKLGSTDNTWQEIWVEDVKGIKNLNAGVDGVGNPLSATITGNWTLANGSKLNATYADLAEKYSADAQYEPGTVVVFGGEAEVTLTNTKGDRKVAGVVSTDPAFVMNERQEGDHVVDIALQGRVPCKVIGQVHKGDMLVTSAVPGYAMVSDDPKLGSVIGKAVGDKDDAGKGLVEVVVGRL